MTIINHKKKDGMLIMIFKDIYQSIKQVFCIHKKHRFNFIRQINDNSEIKLLYGKRYEYECSNCKKKIYTYAPISCDGCKYYLKVSFSPNDINTSNHYYCTINESNNCTKHHFIYHTVKHE